MQMFKNDNFIKKDFKKFYSLLVNLLVWFVSLFSNLMFIVMVVFIIYYNNSVKLWEISKEYIDTILESKWRYLHLSEYSVPAEGFFIIDSIPIKYYLLFSFSIFFIGLIGIVLNRKNLINLMLCIELMLFGASLNFIFFGMYLSSPLGQIFALIIITVAAADSAIGLVY